ncbi:major facilitator family protein [Cystoisospora suis]|uniref:Major facilitator family protein n=1 Tax=Cystoisospora suis TaxID=483139 RepID=A0A2C6KJ59_9APIC|nr:major facilitator family protein [Cystoisospora suis]
MPFYSGTTGDIQRAACQRNPGCPPPRPFTEQTDLQLWKHENAYKRRSQAGDPYLRNSFFPSFSFGKAGSRNHEEGESGERGLLVPQKPEYKLGPSVVTTQAVLNTVSGIEGLDLQLMPASFKILQADFSWALQDLGALVFYQSISQALSGLVWGYLADRTSRVRLLASGCCAWGLVSMFIAMSTQYWQFALLKVLNGIAMASIGPVAQSLISDLFPSNMRGEQFGWLQFFLCGGCIVGALIGGSMASLTVVQGVRGWRLAFFVSGMLSVCAGLLVRIIAVEPRRQEDFGGGEEDEPRSLMPDESTSGALREMYRRCRNFCRATLSRTFFILLLQGICGYIPLHAFQFYTMWFQYIGMPDWQASVLTACPLIGSMIGSLFGGWLGDQADKRSRFHGRPFVGQMGTLLSIPLIYTGLLVIPRRPEFFGLFALDMLLLGFAIAWCPSGVNRPILSEIVASDARASVFATQIVFEGSVAAMLGSPVIAFMAESLFGYRGVGASAPSEALKSRNIEALANALLVATAFPWTVCFFLYGLLHFTYKQDHLALE